MEHSQNYARSNQLRKKAENILQEKGVQDPSLYEKDLESLVQELNIHQIELEQQNAEMTHIQNELERSRNRFADLFDYAPNGYFLIFKDYHILDVNQTGSQMLGYENHEVSGERFTSFIHPDYQDVFYFH